MFKVISVDFLASLEAGTIPCASIEGRVGSNSGVDVLFRVCHALVTHESYRNKESGAIFDRVFSLFQTRVNQLDDITRSLERYVFAKHAERKGLTTDAVEAYVGSYQICQSFDMTLATSELMKQIYFALNSEGFSDFEGVKRILEDGNLWIKMSILRLKMADKKHPK